MAVQKLPNFIYENNKPEVSLNFYTCPFFGILPELKSYSAFCKVCIKV